MTRVKRRFQRESKDFYLVELLYSSDNFNKKIKQKQREVGKKDGETRGAWKESAKEPLMIYRGFSFITANSPSPQTPNSSWFQRGSREREREREKNEARSCHAPDFSSFTRLIPWRWYVRAAVSALKAGERNASQHAKEGRIFRHTENHREFLALLFPLVAGVR